MWTSARSTYGALLIVALVGLVIWLLLLPTDHVLLIVGGGTFVGVGVIGLVQTRRPPRE